MGYVYRTIWSAFLFCFRFNTVRFAVGRLEAPIIALALYIVQMNLLGELAFERFLLSWLGILVLSWTLKSILRLDEPLILQGKTRGVLTHPDTHAVLSRMGGLFIEFLVDLLIIATVMVAYRRSPDVAPMIWSAVFVILAQGTVNFALMIFHIWTRPRFNFKNIITVLFLAFAIMSPVLFMFHDLDQFGGRYFTSINPVSHFLAAYYNIFWFGVPISLKVLPFFVVAAIAIIFAYCCFVEPRVEDAQVRGHEGDAGIRQLSFRRFTERGSISGLELFFTFYALGKQPIGKLAFSARKLMVLSEYRDQLNRGLSTYSRLNDMHLDLLLAACLADNEVTQINLPDDEIYHVTKTELNAVLLQINAIMGTKLSISDECLQRIAD